MIKNENPTPRRFWRSLEELQNKPEFEQFLHREFPVAASEYPEGVSRRRWLQLMGASLAMGGAIGCRYPEEGIAPFVIRPEGRVPGEFYSRATNLQWAGRNHHLLVSCVDGRPLKIEGNPDHPGSNGGTDHYVQASILDLYDPDRSGEVLRRESGKAEIATWESFDSYLGATVASVRTAGGRVAVLMQPTSSPSLVRLVGKLRESFPAATVCVYDSVDQGVQDSALATAFGRKVNARLHLDKAKVALAIESDLLGSHPSFVSNARGFGASREPKHGEMGRLYVVEGGFSSTGMAADSRLALSPSQAVVFLAKLEQQLDALLAGEQHEHGDETKPYDELSVQERFDRFVDVVAHDLVGAKGASLVTVGSALGEAAVVAGYRINHKLENIGKTITLGPATSEGLGELTSIAQLTEKLNAGDVDMLLVLGGNPVYTAPSDLGLAKAISRTEHTVYLGLYDDETAQVCAWSLPEAHPLESWGDIVGDTGYFGICQPHILPLLGGRTGCEVIARLLGESEVSGEAIVRRTADGIAGGSLSDRQWRQLLHDGYHSDLSMSDLALEYAGPTDAMATSELALISSEDEVNRDAIEVLFTPADGLFDGRFANNGWLQEMPQALTKLTWDNAAVMNPGTATALGVEHGVKVALSLGESTVELPVFVIPGVALGVVSVAYGYGRKRAGAVGGSEELDIASVGVDVSPLRLQQSMIVAEKVVARPRPRAKYDLATTQNHWAIDDLGREEVEDRSYQLIREGSSELFKTLPDFAQYLGVHSPDTGSLWPEPINEIEKNRPELPQWGMAIDLSKCIGCNACVVACQSENNVPIVGKEQVLMGREMHWLRIDRYFQGDADHAEVVQEPMMCQHCETAPCEQVCPVAATLHTDEGINAMAYNRCIGTRYCANNCPFKVRRFNYFNWNENIGVGYGIDAYDGNIESANRKLQQLVLNPEVTVRGRGVMEKCTFCVQRVEAAKIEARKDGGRPIRDGDVKSACQTACPTQAIVFGNVADEASEVSQWKKDPRNYAVLDQLNISPRLTYLARIRNVHPRLMTAHQLADLQELPEKAAHHHGHGDHGHDDHGHDDHGTDSHAEPHGEESHEGPAKTATSESAH